MRTNIFSNVNRLFGFPDRRSYSPDHGTEASRGPVSSSLPKFSKRLIGLKLAPEAGVERAKRRNVSPQRFEAFSSTLRHSHVSAVRKVSGGRSASDDSPATQQAPAYLRGEAREAWSPSYNSLEIHEAPPVYSKDSSPQSADTGQLLVPSEVLNKPTAAIKPLKRRAPAVPAKPQQQPQNLERPVQEASAASFAVSSPQSADKGQPFVPSKVLNAPTAAITLPKRRAPAAYHKEYWVANNEWDPNDIRIKYRDPNKVWTHSDVLILMEQQKQRDKAESGLSVGGDLEVRQDAVPTEHLLRSPDDLRWDQLFWGLREDRGLDRQVKQALQKRKDRGLKPPSTEEMVAFSENFKKAFQKFQAEKGLSMLVSGVSDEESDI